MAIDILAAMALMAWFMNQIGVIAETVHGNYRGENGEPYHVVVEDKIASLKAKWTVISNNICNYVTQIAKK